MIIKQLLKVSSFLKVSIFGLMLLGFFTQCEDSEGGFSPVKYLAETAHHEAVKLTWMNPLDDNFSYVKIVEGSNIDSTTSQEIIIDSLENDRTYTFKVTAYDVNNNASSSESITSTPVAAVYPSGLIACLTDWKLNLPVDEDGADSRNASKVSLRNTNSWEIEDDDLIDFEYSPYFELIDNEVIFRAHCGGATTSGSKYPRSELRQRVGGGDNYWSVQDYQYLYTELRVTHTPVEKPEVCMVQIHGPYDEPLRVQYHAEDGLEIIWNEDNSRDISKYVSYTLGEKLAIAVTVRDGKITCTVTNMATNETYSYTWTSSDSTGYFKVGCYTQSSMFLSEIKSGSEDEDPDAYGEVAVSKINFVENY